MVAGCRRAATSSLVDGMRVVWSSRDGGAIGLDSAVWVMVTLVVSVSASDVREDVSDCRLLSRSGSTERKVEAEVETDDPAEAGLWWL